MSSASIKCELSKQKASPSSLWVLLGILLLAAVLRIPGYTESVWIDELYSSNIFVGEPLTLLKTIYSDIHPPLYALFAHFWNQAVGSDREIWLRLPALLCGLGTIVLVWRLGMLFVDASAGLMAAALLAMSPVHIWYSQEARSYSMTLFLLLLAILSYYRLLQGRRMRCWTAVFSLALSCLVFTHYYNLVFAGLLLVLTATRKSPHRRRVLFNILLVTGALGLYMVAKLQLSEIPVRASYLRGFGVAEAWELFSVWFLTGEVFGRQGHRSGFGEMVTLVIQVLGVLAVLRGSWRLLRRHSSQDSPPGLDLLLMVIALPVFLGALTIFVSDQVYIERSALPALPFFAVVIGSGVTGWRSKGRRRASLSLVIACAAVLLVTSYNSGSAWTTYKPNPDWRGAARFLSTELPSDGSRAVLYSDYPSPTALTYYDGRMQETKNFVRNDDKTNAVLGKFAQIFGTEGWPGEPLQAVIKRWIDDSYRLLADTEAKMKLEIIELKPAAGDTERNHPFNEPRLDTFWLLIHTTPTQFGKQVLADERIRIESTRHFRSLTLYKLQRD